MDSIYHKDSIRVEFLGQAHKDHHRIGGALSLHGPKPIRLDKHSSTFCQSRSCLETRKKKRLIEQALASSHCRASMPLLVGDLLNSETLAQGQTIRHRYSACPDQTLVDCLSQHGIDWISRITGSAADLACVGDPGDH
jgi:hypothetical protein